MDRAKYCVLSTPYAVPSTQLSSSPRSPALLLSLVLLLAGCQSTNVADREPSFHDQLAAVKAGASDSIHVSSHTVSDADLATAAEAKTLKRLSIENADAISPATLERLSRLPNLETFWFSGRGIDDEALAHIANMKSLKIINIPRGNFTDAGLTKLKQLPNLVQLRFGSPHVTDAGMPTLAEFPALLRLHLIDVPITGQGLEALAKIDQLESLYIDGGNFTDADADALFKTRPRLHVHFNQHHHDRDPHPHAH